MTSILDLARSQRGIDSLRRDRVVANYALLRMTHLPKLLLERLWDPMLRLANRSPTGEWRMRLALR